MADIIPIEPDSCTSSGRMSFFSTYKYPIIIGAVIILVLIILIWPVKNLKKNIKFWHIHLYIRFHLKKLIL